MIDDIATTTVQSESTICACARAGACVQWYAAHKHAHETRARMREQVAAWGLESRGRSHARVHTSYGTLACNPAAPAACPSPPPRHEHAH
eukprot:6192053-Pleurochrysis_carterae.AAC.1